MGHRSRLPVDSQVVNIEFKFSKLLESIYFYFYYFYNIKLLYFW